MLREIDKVFLREFVSLPYMGKSVSAIGLYQTGFEAEKTAELVHQQVLLMDQEKARAKAKKEGDAQRVQIVVIAKLLAEIVGGVEDLGALCYAIKNRHSESIFIRYVLSKSEPSNYHKFVVDSLLGIGLHELLSIPRLDDLKKQFKNDPEKIKGFEQLYYPTTAQIIAAAKMYKDLGTPVIEDPNPGDYAYVICDVIDTKKLHKEDTRGDLVRKYNKIKHRFLVFEDRARLNAAMETQNIELEIVWSMISRKPEDVLNLYNKTMEVSRCLFTVAGLLIILEDNGLDL